VKTKIIFSILIILSAFMVFPVLETFGQVQDIVQIEMGGSPAEMVLVNGDLYVSDPAEGRIVIIDGKTNEINGTISTIKGIDNLIHIEGTNKLYATVLENPVVLFVNLDTRQVENTIEFPNSVMTQWSKSNKPYGQREYVNFQTSGVGMDYDPNNKMLYVANLDGHSLEVIDTTTNQFVKTIPGIPSPVHIVVDSQTNSMLILQYHENQVAFVDLTTNKVLKELDTGFAPANVVVDTHHRKAYITHHASPQVTVIDLDKQTIIKKINVPSPTHAIGIDDNDEIIYATYMPDSPTTQAANKNQVAIIDGLSDKILNVLDIENNPYNILIDTENQKGYATIIKNGLVLATNLESGSFEGTEQESRGTADMGDQMMKDQMMEKEVLPPLKQIKSGIAASEIVCKEGLDLIFKASNGNPACVSPTSATKLVAMGWAK
jgi:YVTN family beta-propeller protein